MDRPQDIAGILVTLFVDDQQALFIMLSSDGAISRMGTGSIVNAEMDLFAGRTSPTVFESLKQAITPACSNGSIASTPTPLSREAAASSRWASNGAMAWSR